MGMFKHRGRGLVCAGVGAIATLAALVAPLASADPPPTTQLLVGQATDLSDGVVDFPTVNLSSTVGDPAHSATVYVGLDANCPNVFVDPSAKAKAGQKYTILTAFNPVTNSAPTPAVIAGISPSQPSGLICSSITSFTITGLAPGETTLSFTPMAKNRGLQDKLSPTPATVDVVVDGGIGDFCVPADDPSCQTQGDRPAAPAVANMLLDSQVDGNTNDVASACSTYFGARSWRGSTISYVALNMRLPESVKDDTSQYPTLIDWENYVLALVGTACHTSFVPIPNS